MITSDEIWPQLKKSKSYRREFAAQFAKRAIPHQIALLMKQFEISQNELAKRAEMHQGTISRAVNPDYGDLTVNTLIRIASGFDAAFVGAIIPFSELPDWFNRFYSERFAVPSFEQEDAERGEIEKVAAVTQSEADELTRLDASTSSTPGKLLFFGTQGSRKGPQRAKRWKPDSTKVLTDEGTTNVG